MDFAFTPDQELLRDTARAMLGNECPTSLLRAHMTDRAAAGPLWNHLREFAALGAGDATDLCVFVEQTGYVAAPGPFFASVALCAPLLAAIEHPALDAIVAGQSTGTVAVAGRAGEWLPNAEPVKYFVLDADLMEHEIVNCHPLTNDATTSIAGADLIRFMEATGHTPLVLKVTA